MSEEFDQSARDAYKKTSRLVNRAISNHRLASALKNSMIPSQMLGTRVVRGLKDGSIQKKINDMYDNRPKSITEARDRVRDAVYDNTQAGRLYRDIRNGNFKKGLQETYNNSAYKDIVDKTQEFSRISIGEHYNNLQNAINKSSEAIKNVTNQTPETLQKASDYLSEKGITGAAKDGLKTGVNRTKDNYNKLKNSPVGQNVMNSKEVQAMRAIGGAAKHSINAAKTMASVAQGAINPAAAATMIAKEMINDITNNPQAVIRNCLMVCGCVCGPVLGCLMAILLPFIFLLGMFFGMLTNDSAKSDGPKAASSWVYKYAEADYKQIMSDKISVNPDNTYIVSHNAKMQADVQNNTGTLKNYIDKPINDISNINNGERKGHEKVVVNESSEDMRNSKGFTDETIYLYKEANLKSERIIFTGSYGDPVTGYLEQNATTVVENNGFIPIVIETASSDRTNEVLSNKEGENGLSNANKGSYKKDIFYIEKRLVYKRAVHDPELEYTIEDEYKVMSSALRKALQKKQDESLKQGNQKIDSEQSRFQSETTQENLESNELYQLTGAAVIKNKDGSINKDLSSIKNPTHDTFDAGTSRSNLSASARSNVGQSQDVATILSGYAASKADSLPDEGYYQMLDRTMQTYLSDTLNLMTPPLTSQAKQRILTTKTVKDFSVMKPVKTVEGFLLVYDEAKMADKKFTRYSVSDTGMDFEVYISPNGVSDIKSNAKNRGGIYLEKELNKMSGSFIRENPQGRYVILNSKDYVELYGADKNLSISDVTDKITKYPIWENEVITVLDMNSNKDETYVYQEFVANYTISPLDANQVVWKFFENSIFYPMIKNNTPTKDVNGNSFKIGDASSWQEKLKLARSLPYYQQQLSYIFNNDPLKSKPEYFFAENPLKGYANEPDLQFFKVGSGSPKKDEEKISYDQFKELMGDKELSNTEIDKDGFMLNYKKETVENSSTSKTKNIAGIEANKQHFLWLIPIGFEQQYRRASEPEMIYKHRLDPDTGEYIKKFSHGPGATSAGGLPPGSAVEPVKNFRNYISSPYGMRTHPVTGQPGSMHNGIDIARPEGEPMYALFDAKVVIAEKSGYNGGYGLYVKIQRADGVSALYAHASSVLVNVGDQVKAGQEIAKMGTTGMSTGSHLHLEISKDGSNEGRYDPMLFLNNHAVTVSSQNTDNSNGKQNNRISTDGTLTDEHDEDGIIDTTKVVMSVGNKMDYWYDNIMQLLDDEEASNSQSGNGGQAVAELAMSYLGDVGGVYFKNSYMGKTSGATKYTPGNTFDWCAAFVSVIMKDAGFPGFTGMSTTIYPGTANSTSKEEALAPWSYSVSIFKQWAEEHGTLRNEDGSYQPKPGDLIIYDWDKDGVYDHIGFIYSSNSDGYKTIEGNTLGPGSSDEGGYMGVVNSHEWKYNTASHNTKFISIPYPEGDTLEAIATNYAPNALGTTSTYLDKYGRIGLGAWGGEQALNLLRAIEKSQPNEVKGVIAESGEGQTIRDYIDGKIKYDEKISSGIKRILQLPQSKRIQIELLKNRIKDIDKSMSDASPNTYPTLDSRTRIYLIFVQLLSDMYTENNWGTSNKFKELLSNGSAKKGNFDTYVNDIKEMFNNTMTKNDKIGYTYSNWQSVAGQDSLGQFYEPIKGLINKISGTVKSIPDSKLTFGLGSGKTWQIPPGLGHTKSYMGNHLLTYQGSEQYRLKQFTTTGPHGIGMIDGRMTAAMYVGAKGSPKGYGEVGDKIDVKLSTGQVLHLVIADAKAVANDFDNYSIGHGHSKEFALQWGIHNDGSMIEFVLNTQTTGAYPAVRPSFTTIFPGTVETVVNLGPIGK